MVSDLQVSKGSIDSLGSKWILKSDQSNNIIHILYLHQFSGTLASNNLLITAPVERYRIGELADGVCLLYCLRIGCNGDSGNDPRFSPCLTVRSHIQSQGNRPNKGGTTSYFEWMATLMKKRVKRQMQWTVHWQLRFAAEPQVWWGWLFRSLASKHLTYIRLAGHDAPIVYSVRRWWTTTVASFFLVEDRVAFINKLP